ncbi:MULTISPECIES: hypothetical protein [unclassified Modicisalibacter]|uniref:hypothetical protein n=1 Tax=unclassified Modicisalibacter TaxID=2679913 RepID=UPI001CCEFA1F|nr:MULTISPECIES: hypothetical protein [unclassified Modicisalibacter]MBZ9556970.1 hypothetical protein [Modicisalibacter sp. R2A 31.J]MBZ9574316.1 hypothetical protein [Modicisalibacter sp. MOD 31.J]
MVTTKNLTFTITHGRTGTTFLTEAFKVFEDTLSVHEPEPNYANHLPLVKQDPRHAIDFLKQKLSHIDGIREANYVETSNVFGKGFFIPLLRMGITPNLVLLNRNFRKTATSLFQRGSTPMRTKMGQHFSADPSVPDSLPIYSPDSLSDYQLCYWGVLDAFARQLQAADIYDGQDCSCYRWAASGDFHDFDFLKSVGATFGLSIGNEDAAKKQHDAIKAKHHNPNRSSSKASLPASLDEEEIAVLDRIAYYRPIVIEKALNSRFMDGSVKAAFGFSD